jgi:outer membrane lipoprotein LolB
LIRASIIGLALLGLTGCTRVGGLDENSAREQLWRETRASLIEYEQWNMHARAAVTLPGEAYNIGLQWYRDADYLLLLLEAPFGQGVIRIESGDAGVYRLQLPDGRLYLNDSPEALLEDVIGWSIPVSGLDYWIRGLPRPDSEYSQRIDADGLSRDITQDSWSIGYLDYYSFADGLSLPRRIRLAHDDLEMRLAIDSWQAEIIEDGPSDLFPDFN